MFLMVCTDLTAAVDSPRRHSLCGMVQATRARTEPNVAKALDCMAAGT
jgi:hypothetical protein